MNRILRECEEVMECQKKSEEKAVKKEDEKVTNAKHFKAYKMIMELKSIRANGDFKDKMSKTIEWLEDLDFF